MVTTVVAPGKLNGGGEFWLPSSAEEGRAQTWDCAGVVRVVAIPLTIRPFHDRSDHPAAACVRGIPSLSKEGNRSDPAVNVLSACLQRSPAFPR